MTDALKTALEALFKQIVDFVKAIFANEVPEFGGLFAEKE